MKQKNENDSRADLEEIASKLEIENADSLAEDELRKSIVDSLKDDA